MKKMVGNGGQHDVGMKEKVCGWVPEGFMSVNTSLGAGKAFLKSIHHQYIEWGVDFIKHDCVFGSDLSVDEITIVSQMMKEADHPITYSLSPGTSATPSMAKQVSGLANMYRITTDDWDSWRDVASHLNITRNFADAEMIGGSGLLGKSWPDLDMLPLGWLTDLEKLAFDYIASRLTLDEQRTQVHLASGDETRAWIASGRADEIYLAFFNLNNTRAMVSTVMSDIATALPWKRAVRSCRGKEVWSRRNMGVMNHTLSMAVEAHGSAHFVLNCSLKVGIYMQSLSLQS
ncbi:unnamed protein product [Linum tenue]|uniref:alpha-galactosidase n=1 Tax=Linum tenue TaxID=586396 RepID=A0AAV0HZ53_9ROSI|nr:unnamed protein product [Linum tenue]